MVKARAKWEVRSQNQKWNKKSIKAIKTVNPLLGISNDLVTLMRQQFRVCTTCKRIEKTINLTNADHLYKKHGITVTHYKDIWQDVLENYRAEWAEAQKAKNIRDRRLKRADFRKQWDDLLREAKETIEKELEKLNLILIR